MSDLLPVTQADRDAVQAFHRTMAARLMSDIASERPTLGKDEGDAGTLVQAFARHRLAALDSRAGDAGEGADFSLSHDDDPAFLAAWADMEAKGFAYGNEALESVHLGWLMAKGVLTATPAPAVDAVPAGEVKRLRDALKAARRWLDYEASPMGPAETKLYERLMEQIDAALDIDQKQS